MTTTASHPIEIRRLPEGRLRIIWSDGHEAEYPYDYVRGFCPCASCQGHSVTEIRFQPPGGSVEPWRIEPVGNYGVSIQWSDGHATGIYRFDFLREICPCPACAESPQASPGGDTAVQERGEKE